MKDYIFVLGKNVSLSLAELRETGLARGMETVTGIERGTLASWAYGRWDGDPVAFQELLGGTVKIVEKLWEGRKKVKKIKEGITNIANRLGLGDRQYRSMIKMVTDKLSEFRPDAKMIGISLYFREISEARLVRWRSLAKSIAKTIKNLLKEQGISLSIVTAAVLAGKTPFFPPSASRRKKFHSENVEIAIFVGEDIVTAGIVHAIHDGKAEKARGDALKKPPGWKYGIRPRMARIMVNIGHALPGKKILDPFCGIGTIVCEALLVGAHVAGVDINPDNVKYARINVEKTIKKSSGELIGIYESDARELPFENGYFDSVITEPYLGAPYTSPPSPEKADFSLKKYLELMIDVLPEIRRVLHPGGRVVIVAPRIRTTKGFMRIPFENLVRKNGFKHHYMIIDGENWQVVWREIHVLSSK